MYIISNINRLSSVEVSGTKYRQNDIVVRSYQRDEPVFGRVAHFIATSSQEYYFVLNLLDTVGFSEHFHAFKVSFGGSQIDVCVQADLADHHPLVENKTFDSTMSETFIRMKYHVF